MPHLEASTFNGGDGRFLWSGGFAWLRPGIHLMSSQFVKENGAPLEKEGYEEVLGCAGETSQV